MTSPTITSAIPPQNTSEPRLTFDAARVELLLSELRLPGVKLMWAKLAAQSDKEGWPAARFLAALGLRGRASPLHRQNGG